jgi:hypothetical protein
MASTSSAIYTQHRVTRDVTNTDSNRVVTSVTNAIHGNSVTNATRGNNVTNATHGNLINQSWRCDANQELGHVVRSKSFTQPLRYWIPLEFMKFHLSLRF